MTKMVVSERRRSSVGGDDMVRVPQGLPDTLHHLDPLRPTESLDGAVSVLPDCLAVLVETEPADGEVLADHLDHLHWLALNQVQLAPVVPELRVQVLQTLQQEGNLVESAVFCCRSFTIKYEHR